MRTGRDPSAEIAEGVHEISESEAVNSCVISMQVAQKLADGEHVESSAGGEQRDGEPFICRAAAEPQKSRGGQHANPHGELPSFAFAEFRVAASENFPSERRQNAIAR